MVRDLVLTEDFKKFCTKKHKNPNQRSAYLGIPRDESGNLKEKQHQHNLFLFRKAKIPTLIKAEVANMKPGDQHWLNKDCNHITMDGIERCQGWQKVYDF